MTPNPFGAVRECLAEACPPSARVEAGRIGLRRTAGGRWDLASNVAMLAARGGEAAPITVAEQVAAATAGCGWIDAAEAVPPGYVNLRLSTPRLCQALPTLVAALLNRPVAPAGRQLAAQWAIPDAARVQPAQEAAFRVLHAYARCGSVLRHAGPTSGVSTKDVVGSDIVTRGPGPERDVLLCLAVGADIFHRTAQGYNAATILKFLYGLASVFDTMWDHQGGSAVLRFIRPDEPGATRARLALVAAVAQVIRAGLGCLGVEPTEELR